MSGSGGSRSFSWGCLFVLIEFSLWSFFFVLLILARRPWIEQVAMRLFGSLANLMLRNAVMRHELDDIHVIAYGIRMNFGHQLELDMKVTMNCHHAFSS